MSTKERMNKQKVYDSMVREDANMSSFRRVPYYMAPVPVHRSRPCKVDFPCSVGDTVYELYGDDIIPMIVTGFLITQSDTYVLVAEDAVQSPERKLVMSNVYLSQAAARKVIDERKRYEHG